MYHRKTKTIVKKKICETKGFYILFACSFTKNKFEKVLIIKIESEDESKQLVINPIQDGEQPQKRPSWIGLKIVLVIILMIQLFWWVIDIDFDNILYTKHENHIKHKKIFWLCNISCKIFVGVKPLHIWFQKIDDSVKIYDGIII